MSHPTLEPPSEPDTVWGTPQPAQARTWSAKKTLAAVGIAGAGDAAVYSNRQLIGS
ncbi:hypothetical protein [Nocardia anaemiae]|uniref:hypothetical protein n=1 Tax=Nocardia anaemiae TaxID=263910 RepID=UPI000AE3FEB3|nr:hypothetical protein [Nocardia anaemiae]